MVVLRRLLKESNAQALVEFAIILPLMLLLLFAIIEYGRVFHTYLVVSHASREAARVAAVGGTPGEISAAAESAGATIGIDGEDEDDVRIEDVTIIVDEKELKAKKVTVTGHLDLVTPYITPKLFPSDWQNDADEDGEPDSNRLNISRSTVMRLE